MYTYSTYFNHWKLLRTSALAEDFLARGVLSERSTSAKVHASERVRP